MVQYKSLGHSLITITTNYFLFVWFIQVSRGDSPVVGAQVLVDFTVELANGSVAKLSQEPIPLLDNGYGG